MWSEINANPTVQGFSSALGYFRQSLISGGPDCVCCRIKHSAQGDAGEAMMNDTTLRSPPSSNWWWLQLTEGALTLRTTGVPLINFAVNYEILHSVTTSGL